MRAADAARRVDDQVDQTIEIFVSLLLELVATGANGSCGRSVTEQGDLGRSLSPQIDEMLLQNALHTMPTGIQVSNVIGVIATALDHTLEGGIDNRRRSAGLGNYGIALHSLVSSGAVSLCHCGQGEDKLMST